MHYVAQPFYFKVTPSVRRYHGKGEGLLGISKTPADPMIEQFQKLDVPLKLPEATITLLLNEVLVSNTALIKCKLPLLSIFTIIAVI